jgi:hypothetical protein
MKTEGKLIPLFPQEFEFFGKAFSFDWPEMRGLILYNTLK